MLLTAPTNALHVRHWDMNDIYARHACLSVRHHTPIS